MALLFFSYRLVSRNAHLRFLRAVDFNQRVANASEVSVDVFQHLHHERVGFLVHFNFLLRFGFKAGRRGFVGAVCETASTGYGGAVRSLAVPPARFVDSTLAKSFA